jgi:hypothetical protein
MKVDVSSDHNISHFLMAHRAKQLDPILQNTAFEHLFKINSLGTGSSDDEPDMRISGQDARESCDEKVGALVVEEAGYDDNCDCIVGPQMLGRRWSRTSIVWVEFTVPL